MFVSFLCKSPVMRRKVAVRRSSLASFWDMTHGVNACSFQCLILLMLFLLFGLVVGVLRVGL
mgnify:CR=1 FL=1